MKLATPTLLAVALVLPACSKKNHDKAAPAAEPAAKPAPEPQEALIPPMDANNIVSIAIASKDHSTLVAAAKASGYVTGLANPGPLTVFAPTDAAFAKLPAGTVDTLMKPENKDKLQDVLKYHVIPSVYETKSLKDGQVLGMVNGGKVTVHVQPDGTVMVNDAKIVASVRASNGVVHVIDAVLLPPANSGN